MKQSDFNNRKKLCCNCCNVFNPNYNRCPFCLQKGIGGGMLINDVNRMTLQFRHLIAEDCLSIIPFETLSKISKKEKENDTGKSKKTGKRFSRFINFIQKNKRMDEGT